MSTRYLAALGLLAFAWLLFTSLRTSPTGGCPLMAVSDEEWLDAGTVRARQEDGSIAVGAWSRPHCVVDKAATASQAKR